MAEYKLTAFEHTVQHFHDDTVTTFRDDADSPENAAYQEWLAAGGVPTPYSETQPINPALDSKPAKTAAQILGV